MFSNSFSDSVITLVLLKLREMSKPVEVRGYNKWHCDLQEIDSHVSMRRYIFNAGMSMRRYTRVFCSRESMMQLRKDACFLLETAPPSHTQNTRVGSASMSFRSEYNLSVLIHTFKTVKINVKAMELNDRFLLNLIFNQMQFQKLI